MSFRRMITSRTMIMIMLILQFIPMVLFPPASYSPKNQSWWQNQELWLPILLAILAIISIIQIYRHSVAIWPWNLIAFSQGFNIISRLMMILPHATFNESGVQYFNTWYFVLSLLSMGLSTFLLWYMELPEVRMGLYQK